MKETPFEKMIQGLGANLPPTDDRGVAPYFQHSRVKISFTPVGNEYTHD